MIDSVVSAGAVTAELILQYVRSMKNATGSQVKTLHRIVDEKVEALEFGIKEDVPFVGVPLKDLRMKSGILVAGIVRQNGRIVIPTGDDVIKLGGRCDCGGDGHRDPGHPGYFSVKEGKTRE